MFMKLGKCYVTLRHIMLRHSYYRLSRGDVKLPCVKAAPNSREQKRGGET